MNNNNRIFLLFLLTISMLILSCSKQKDYNANNNFLAYYNTFYSAKKNFDNAVKIISKDEELSKPSASTIQLLNNAIENASIIENKFYKTKYLDDAFYIIARSTYLKGKISGSRYYFNKIVENYKDSQYYYESLIWLGFINIDLGKTDKINSIISQLEGDIDNLSNNLFLFYMLKAKASEFFDVNPDIKLNYLLAAIDNANNKIDKIKVYKKLLSVSEDNNNYKDSAHYLEAILKNIESSDNNKNKLLDKWFYYNCLNDNYNKNYSYIEEKMNDNLSTLDEIFYKTQLAVTFSYDQEYNKSKTVFLDLIDKFHNPSASNLKPYFCDIHYHLGNLYLKHYGDFEEAKVYFDKCKNDCVGSEKAKIKAETQNYSSAITELLSLDAESEYVNEIKSEENNNENEEKNPYFISMQEEKDNDMPEEILYEMGLVLLFKLGLTDSSLVKFKTINQKFPESDYAYKSLILLNELEPDKKWDKKIESEFSHLINLENEDKKLVDLRSIAWNKLDVNISECINEFLSIFNNHNDSLSLYYAAYLYDQFLNDIDNSLKYYRLYMENFPEHEFKQQTARRIDDIESLIDNEIDLFNKQIFYQTGYSMIEINSMKLDSIKFYLNKAKEIQMISPLDLNIDNFISFIESYENNSDSTKINSIEDYKQFVEKNVSDSIIDIDTFQIGDFYIEIDFELLHEKLSNVQNIKDKLFKAGCADEDALNYDPDVRLDDASCVYEITEGSFKWNQSMTQFFYFVEFATYDNVELTEDDWMVAYNNDIVVGARQYVANGNIDIVIMGDDGEDYSSGYCKSGDIPNIKVYRKSGEVASMNIEVIEGTLEFQSTSHTKVRLSNK